MPVVRIPRTALVPWGLPRVCLLTGETEDVSFEKLTVSRRPLYSHVDTAAIALTVFAWDSLDRSGHVIAVGVCVVAVLATTALQTNLEGAFALGPKARKALALRRRCLRLSWLFGFVCVLLVPGGVGSGILVMSVVVTLAQLIPVGYEPRFKAATDFDVDLVVPSDAAADAIRAHLAGPVALPPEARCRHHSEPATSVCIRCGDFACTKCFAGTIRLCSECRLNPRT